MHLMLRNLCSLLDIAANHLYSIVFKRWSNGSITLGFCVCDKLLEIVCHVYSSCCQLWYFFFKLVFSPNLYTLKSACIFGHKKVKSHSQIGILKYIFLAFQMFIYKSHLQYKNDGQNYNKNYIFNDNKLNFILTKNTWLNQDIFYIQNFIKN